MAIFFSILSFLIFSVCSVVHAAGDADIRLRKAALSTEWLRLVHYKSTTFGGYKSEIDSERFFFAGEQGKTDPHAELLATLRGFGRPVEGNVNAHPICRFPSRYDFARRHLSVPESKLECPEFNVWMQSLDPEGVSIVYANNFPNNPASIFGHTFLRLHSKKESGVQAGRVGGRKIDLLDYAVGYAASTSDANIFHYVIGGLFGWFPGLFDLGPYYNKVNMYNNLESRDLWEYRLDISPEQARKMMTHFWELGHGMHADYYFLDENCSYWILTLLEVARLDWNISDKYFMYVAPPDTIKVIYNVPGAVTDIQFRPSLFHKFQHRLNYLNRGQKRQLETLTSPADDDLAKTVEQISGDPFVIETALASLSFLRANNEGQFNQHFKPRFTQLLVARSKLPTINDKKFDTVASDDRPDKAHDDHATSLGFGFNQDNAFSQLTLRFGNHDFLSRDIGKPAYSIMEMLNLSLRFYHGDLDQAGLRRRVQLEELKLFHLSSLFATSRYVKKWSFEVLINIHDLKELRCSDCFASNIEIKIGKSYFLWHDRVLAYGLGGVKVEHHRDFSGNFRLGPTLKTGLHYRSKYYRNKLEAEVLYDAFQSQRNDLQLRGLFENSLSLATHYELRLRSLVYPDLGENSLFAHEHVLSVLHHF